MSEERLCRQGYWELGHERHRGCSCDSGVPVVSSLDRVVHKMSDDNVPWTPWQFEYNRLLELAMAEMDRKELELLATVEGDGNEYMVVHTLDGKAELVMTKQGGGNDAKGG
jgi:hypothetical protein